jgi:AsmA-like C-terminal region
MRWIAPFLRGLLLVLAAILLGLGCALFALERTSWLERRVRNDLEARLQGPVRFDALRLRWLDPALELDGLELGVPGFRLERVRVVLRGDARRLVRAVLVEVDGGELAFGPNLQSRLAALFSKPSAGPRAEVTALPTVVVKDLALRMEHPRWGDLPLGQVDASLALDARGRPHLSGRLRPALAPAAEPAGGEPSSGVHLSGSEVGPGEFELALSAADIDVAVAPPSLAEPLKTLGLSSLSGRLSVDGRAHVALTRAALARCELRARLSDGEVAWRDSEARLGRIALDLEARCAPGPGESLFDAGAWRALARGNARWRDAQVELYGALGTHAGSGLAARAWAHVRDMPLETEGIASLGLGRVLGPTLASLEARGTCEMWLAGEAPLDGPPRGALEVVCDGRAGLTYRGWPNPRGRPQGFPVPVENVAGRLVADFNPARATGWQIAILQARGSHGADLPLERTVHARGQIRRANDLRTNRRAQLYLRIEGQRLSVDDGSIRTGLAGLDGTEWIWPSFSPHSGEVSFQALLSLREEDARLGARIDVDLAGVGASWGDLPIPLSDLRGRLTLGFDPSRTWLGAIQAEGHALTADRVRLDGRFQGEGAQPGDAKHTPVQELALEAENVALRGFDRQTLVESMPALGQALEEISPSGKVDVRLRLSRAVQDGALTTTGEIVPREVNFSPQALRVPARNVRGRVIVRGSGALATLKSQLEVALAPLVGEWPGDVLVACEGVVRTQLAASTLRVFAAGVAPLDSGLVGALMAAFGAGGEEPSLDLSALSVDGRVDVDGSLSLAQEAGAPKPRAEFRVHLRDNAFHVTPPSGEHGEDSGFGLSGLRGTLSQSGSVLSGTGIRARLGSTPILLREARFTLVEGGGYRLEALPQARRLPLDREHLRFFLDADTVDALVDTLGFQGFLDIDDARLELSGTRESGGRVHFQGEVRPRELRIDLGVPVEVQSAAVSVEHLVYEKGMVRAWAAVRGLEGQIAGRHLERGRLQLTYVEPRLSIFDLDGALEGGRLADLGAEALHGSPAFSLDLQEPFRFDLGLQLVDVQVEGLLRGLFESQFASRGVLSGELRLEGSLERVREIRGDGALRLRDSTLWSIPVMQALFSQLGFDDTAVFERMRTRFQVRDGAFHMSDMQVYSPLLQLVGEGTLDMEGRLHHDLEVRYSLIDRLGPFTRLVYWIQNNLLRLAVRGDMSRPRVELQGILSVFQARSSPGRDLPVPALAPLSRRF